MKKGITHFMGAKFAVVGLVGIILLCGSGVMGNSARFLKKKYVARENGTLKIIISRGWTCSHADGDAVKIKPSIIHGDMIETVTFTKEQSGEKPDLKDQKKAKTSGYWVEFTAGKFLKHPMNAKLYNVAVSGNHGPVGNIARVKGPSIKENHPLTGWTSTSPFRKLKKWGVVGGILTYTVTGDLKERDTIGVTIKK